MGVQSLGWKLGWRCFRVYLEEKYAVGTAFLFIGFIPENQQLYTRLQMSRFTVVFKPMLARKSSEAKGNVDADLVLKAMTEYAKYEKAVIVTSDGDFYSLVEYLYQTNKLETVLSTSPSKCSALLKKTAKERIQFLDVLKDKLEYAAGK